MDVVKATAFILLLKVLSPRLDQLAHKLSFKNPLAALPQSSLESLDSTHHVDEEVPLNPSSRSDVPRPIRDLFRDP